MSENTGNTGDSGDRPEAEPSSSAPKATPDGLDSVDVTGLAEMIRGAAVIMDMRIDEGTDLSVLSGALSNHSLERLVVLAAGEDHAPPRVEKPSGQSGRQPEGQRRTRTRVAAVLLTSRVPVQRRAGAEGIAPAAIADPEPEEDAMLARLTPREREVIRLLALGMDVHLIARETGLSVHTCRDYVKSLLSKLDAHSQLEAVAKAARFGILHQDLGA